MAKTIYYISWSAPYEEATYTRCFMSADERDNFRRLWLSARDRVSMWQHDTQA